MTLYENDIISMVVYVCSTRYNAVQTDQRLTLSSAFCKKKFAWLETQLAKSHQMVKARQSQTRLYSHMGLVLNHPYNLI